jgi:hypothetical protein
MSITIYQNLIKKQLKNINEKDKRNIRKGV